MISCHTKKGQFVTWLRSLGQRIRRLKSRRDSTLWQRRFLFVGPLFFFFLGMVLVSLRHIDLQVLKGFPAWIWGIVDGVGIALITAVILGVSIEWVFRQKLLEDVFRASIGYLLPEGLKPELQWIYGQKTLCVEHVSEYTLMAIDEDTLKMRVSTRRTFENISQDTHSVRLYIAIDEWFHKGGRSCISEFGYRIGDERTSRRGNDVTAVKRENCTLEFEAENDIKLPPRGKITTWWEFEEIKRTNDVNYIVFEYPTMNPLVIVKRAGELGVKVGFSHRAQLAVQELAKDTYRLPGTLLPGQAIEVRWWRKTNAEAWGKDTA